MAMMKKRREVSGHRADILSDQDAAFLRCQGKDLGIGSALQFCGEGRLEIHRRFTA